MYGWHYFMMKNLPASLLFTIIFSFFFTSPAYPAELEHQAKDGSNFKAEFQIRSMDNSNIEDAKHSPKRDTITIPSVHLKYEHPLGEKWKVKAQVIVREYLYQNNSNHDHDFNTYGMFFTRELDSKSTLEFGGSFNHNWAITLGGYKLLDRTAYDLIYKRKLSPATSVGLMYSRKDRNYIDEKFKNGFENTWSINCKTCPAKNLTATAGYLKNFRNTVTPSQTLNDSFVWLKLDYKLNEKNTLTALSQYRYRDFYMVGENDHRSFLMLNYQGKISKDFTVDVNYAIRALNSTKQTSGYNTNAFGLGLKYEL